MKNAWMVVCIAAICVAIAGVWLGVLTLAALDVRQWIGFGMLACGVALTYLADFLQRKTPAAERSLWWKLPGAVLALGGALLVFL